MKCSEVLQCSDVLLVLFYRSVYGCIFCILCLILYDMYSYCFIDMYALLCILFANWHSPATLTEVFPCFFLSCKANARVYLAKTGHGPHSS